MAFDASDPLGSLGINAESIKAGFYDIAQWVIWGVVILGIGAWLWFMYQDKKVYIYPVRIFRRRANGLIKEINTFGGYIVKEGQTIFTIKMSRFKKKELGRLPDSNLMDEEDRIYFYQLSPDAPLLQCKRSFQIERIEAVNESFVEPSVQQKEERIIRYVAELNNNEDTKRLSEDQKKLLAIQRLEEEIEEEKVKTVDVTSAYYTPVPTDQKMQAQMDIKKLASTLGVDVNKQFAYFVIGVVALVILGAIIFYIAVNKGGLPILE